MFNYYKNSEDTEPTIIDMDLIKSRLSNDEIIEFIGLALMLKYAVEESDGEYSAISRRKIAELEEKIKDFSHGIRVW